MSEENTLYQQTTTRWTLNGISFCPKTTSITSATRDNGDQSCVIDSNDELQLREAPEALTTHKPD